MFIQIVYDDFITNALHGSQVVQKVRPILR